MFVFYSWATLQYMPATVITRVLYNTRVMTVATVKSPRNKRQTHTIKLGKYIFKNIEFIANFTV